MAEDANIKNFSGILSNIKSATDVLNARKGDIDNTLHNASPHIFPHMNAAMTTTHTTLTRSPPARRPEKNGMASRPTAMTRPI